ncbi:hypothetical protein F4703DRAFT_1908624 [Phycomyces blakesleeanus]
MEAIKPIDITFCQLPPDPPVYDNSDPTAIRRKPGRKPNPASPALRKAQNRAAQRAFRERKERHTKDLESTVHQIREHRDRLRIDNERLKTESEIIKSENWYLKGIVLTLQLVCLQHNLVIPQHGPYVNDQALSALAQSIPHPIASYIHANANANNKISDVPSEKYLSKGSILVNKDGLLHPIPGVSMSSHQPLSNSPTTSVNRRSDIVQLHSHATNLPRELKEPAASNLAAIEALRLRLQTGPTNQSTPFTIQPTVLQLTIPHDPRIDLIPTPHMRDRMILFRDQFDLDDCFRCLVGNSVFHGGDPALAGNWQLAPEFFEKFWFLTIDYDLRRTTNRWRRLQGLHDIAPNAFQRSQPQVSFSDLSSFFGLAVHLGQTYGSPESNNSNNYSNNYSNNCNSNSNSNSYNSNSNSNSNSNLNSYNNNCNSNYNSNSSISSNNTSTSSISDNQNISSEAGSMWDTLWMEQQRNDFDNMLNTMVDASPIY